MNGTRKTTSIARQLNWHFSWRDMLRIVITDCLVIVAAVCSWCFAVESIIVPNYSIEAITQRSVTAASGDGLWSLLGSVQYHFGEEEIFTASAGQFSQILFVCMCILLGFQLLGWILDCIGGTNEIRKFLKPIDEIAQVTESISNDGFDPEKFHSLEQAIDHINGTTPDEQLNIGDDDLTGLQTAVNNLIKPLHSSYRQQVRFVDDASHELRTPIAVIQGYVNMLDRWGKHDETVLEESIAAIKTESEHMKTLVEQLLFLARGDSGRQKLNLEELSLGALLTEVYEESKMIDPNHEYRLSLEADITVKADVAMLKQAVRILVDNAAKYTPPGAAVTLRLRKTGEELPCIDVQDNGIGMKQTDAIHVFDRFYRSDPARNSASGGSGLGLAIAKWIIDKHHGYFEVKSYEDIGTRISIVLPQSRFQKA